MRSQAEAARARNDGPAAIELYSRALQLNPKWTEGWWQLGSLQYSAEAYAEARDDLSRYIAAAPIPGAAFGLRALCEMQTAEFEKALSDVQFALSLGGAEQPVQEQKLRYDEGILLARLGRFEEALNNDAFFTRRGVASPEVLLAIGLAGLRMPVLPEDLPPGKNELVMSAGRAAAQYLKGDDSGAAQNFTSLLDRFPREANLHSLYGYFLLASNLDGAVQQFREALTLAPEDVHANLMLAWVLLLQRNGSAALPYAQAAMAKQTESAQAQLVFGRALVETGKVQEGIQHLERARQLTPQNLEVHIALAEAYSSSGDRSQARAERALCLKLTADKVNRVAVP